MLVDTDVMIWLLRGSPAALAALEPLPEAAISDVTVMELLQGSRGRHEQNQVKRMLSNFPFRLVPVSERISNRAVALVEEYAVPSGLRLADALLAATALEMGETLLTGNWKHFQAIRKLEVKKFTP